MKYLILLLLAKIMLIATSPQEINFEQTDDYHKAEFSGNFKMVDYYKGKLYLCYSDADSHYIASFYDDLKLNKFKALYSKSPTVNLLISNDKKTYSLNAYKSESEHTSQPHGYKEKSDNMVHIKHEIYRWEDDVKIFESNKYSNIMNSDYNYLYDNVTSNYQRIKLDGGEFAGEYTSHTYTTEYITENSENNLYVFSKYLNMNRYYHYYYDVFEKIEYCLINASLKQNVVNEVELCNYFFSDYEPTYQIFGKNIKSPLFSPDENYFTCRLYTYPKIYVLKSEPTDTLLIYELPITKEPKYVKFDRLSNIKCFSPNSNSLLMALNNQIYNFDLFSGKEISKMDFTFEDEILAMDVSPENNTLALVTYNSQSKNNNIYIFDYDNYFSQIASYEENDNNQIKISPNPASDYIEISLDGAVIQSGHHLDIEIYDVLGNSVLISTPSLLRNATPCSHPDLSGQEGNFKIDVSQLPKGVYFVKVPTMSNCNFIKFIKK